MIRILSFLFFGLISCNLEAQEAEKQWIFVKETDGISVYHRFPENSNLKELKLSTKAKTTSELVVSTLTNIDSLPKWGYLCSEASIIKLISETEFYYYFVSDVPWPMSDRDIVIHMRVMMNKQSGITTIKSNNSEGLVPVKEGLVRIKDMTAKWVLTPVETGLIQIEYYISMDPGGLIPKWLVNYGMIHGPINTISSLKEIVEKKRKTDKKNI